VNGSLLLAAETFVWGVQGICNLHLLPCNPKLVLQQFAPPYDLLSLQQAATSLGLRSGLRPTETLRLPDLPIPFVALLKPEAASRPGRLALVIQCDERGITYLEQGKGRSSSCALADFRPQFAGMVMLCEPVMRQRNQHESKQSV
jgi:subfamily B ATP-binding cassette protein HlyB/CyaB